MEETSEFWRKCSSCKSPIQFGQVYWVCSVSTCTRARTGLIFCKVSCFDAHVPMMNHRDAGALEKRAPSAAQWRAELAAEQAGSSAAAESGAQPGARSPSPAAPSGDGSAKREVLVVVSKTKDYVRASSGFNTSDGVMSVLSDKVRELLDDAIRRAAQDGRKTVLDRDFR